MSDITRARARARRARRVSKRRRRGPREIQRVQLDTRSALLGHLPDLGVDRIRMHGRKHVEARQRFLTHLLETSYRRAHVHAVHRDADSFSRDYLAAGLHADTKRGVIGGLLRPFYEFQDGNRCYSAERGHTKAYRLRRHAWEALDETYSGTDALPAFVTLGDGTPVPFEELPSVCVPEPLSATLAMPKVLAIPVSRINRALESIESDADFIGWSFDLDERKPHGLTLRDGWRLLLACRRWAASIGGIPNIYQLESQGRLGRIGLHVLGLPRPMRELLLAGSGLWDFDLASCYWSIFRSLTRACGLQTPTVDSYLEHKADWHSRWVGITGHRHRESFKVVALSWLSGGGLSPSPWSANTRLVGEHAMQVLKGDRFARALFKEVQRGMSEVVRVGLCEETVDGEQVYLNAAGAIHWPRPQRSDMPARWAHALAGFEQWAIREMCSRVEGLRAIIYDGFIAPEQDVEALERLIRQRSKEQFGFPLELHLKARVFGAEE